MSAPGHATTNLRQMEQVPRGSGTIELAVVLRFVDIAVDALAEAREEIDALNVYPVPDGDTGTNMYLTVAAARDALREATRGRRPPGRPGRPPQRGPARRPRQQRRHPQPDARSAGHHDRRRRGRGAQRQHHGASAPRGDRRRVRRRRDARGRHHPLRHPGRRRGGRGPRAAAGCPRPRRLHRRRRQRPARLWPARPTSSPVLRDAGVVDAGGRGLSVILDAAETVLTGCRPTPVTAPIGAHKIPVPTRGWGTRT